VHSPTDVRGGIALGSALAFGWYAVWPTVDEWIMRGGASTALTYPPLLTALVFAAALILHPQPDPQTPTFLQNALLAGLCTGLVHGSRVFQVDSVPLEPGFSSGLFRVVVGYAVVLLGRGVLREVVARLLSLVGLDAEVS
jgi:membrane-associated phospholipid phosphatase